ncbi:MAG: response regulator [bacterium]
MKETILVVEDDTSILTHMVMMLERENFFVLPASKPRHALDLAKKHNSKISLLVTDMIMPEMNGIDLADQVRLVCPFVPCIFISGYSDENLPVGPNGESPDFLPKPFTSVSLVLKVREVLARGE